MGMKTNNMSEIENSLLVHTRLLDPLKMLQHLVAKASKDLAKAHLSYAEQLARSPAQHLTDGALQKCTEIKQPDAEDGNAKLKTSSCFWKATLADGSQQNTKTYLVDKPPRIHGAQSMFAATVTLFTGFEDKDGGGECSCLKVFSLFSLCEVNPNNK
jgi:hypothetical protein